MKNEEILSVILSFFLFFFFSFLQFRLCLSFLSRISNVGDEGMNDDYGWLLTL